MKRILLITILLATLLIYLPINVLSAERINITVNEKNITFDVPPVIEQGRVLVPMRDIFESLGAEILWDSDTKSIIAIKGRNLIRLTINDKIAYHNNMPIELDVPAKLVNERILVPIRFISEIFGSTVQWNNETRQVSIDNHIELKQQAIEKVKKYFSVLNKAFSQELKMGEWDGILSKSVLNNIDEKDTVIYQPIIGADQQSGIQITDIEIIDASKVINKSINNQDEVEVMVRYTYINPSDHDKTSQRIQYEKVYHLIMEQGGLVIDKEQYQRSRHVDDIPLKTLQLQELFLIEQGFRKNNAYSYEYIIDLNNEFITPVLSSTFGILKWGEPNNPEVRKDLEELYINFDVNVLESTGWKDFLNLNAKRDPTFFVLKSFSSHNQISAILVANLFPSFYFQPAILEIEMEKQNGINWVIKKIENVREYKDIQEFKIKEPEIYNLLVDMENYCSLFFEGKWSW